MMRKLTDLELALVAGGASGDTVTVVGNPPPPQYYPDFDDNGGGGGDTGGGGGGGDGGSAFNPAQGCGGTLNVDTAFISQYEGGRQTAGYVPNAGQSGVTIATGVDLGQRTLGEVRSAIDRVYNQYPVNNSYPGFERGRREAYQTVNSLQPYMGLKGQAAKDMIAVRPLNVSNSFAVVLDMGVQGLMHDAVIANFDRDSDTQFVNLPPNVQTVIIDLAHQYGTGLASSTPNFWSQVTRGDWNAAYNNLMNFGDAYSTRRRGEAALLKEAIDAGLSGLPSC